MKKKETGKNNSANPFAILIFTPHNHPLTTHLKNRQTAASGNEKSEEIPFYARVRLLRNQLTYKFLLFPFTMKKKHKRIPLTSLALSVQIVSGSSIKRANQNT
jgi:hypothetical protein